MPNSRDNYQQNCQLNLYALKRGLLRKIKRVLEIVALRKVSVVISFESFRRLAKLSRASMPRLHAKWIVSQLINPAGIVNALNRKPIVIVGKPPRGELNQ
jgi:hypothetical protein